LESIVSWQQATTTTATSASTEEFQQYWADLRQKLEAWVQDKAVDAETELDWTNEVMFWKVLHGQAVETSLVSPPPAKRVRAGRSKKATAASTSSSTEPLTLPLALQKLAQSCEANNVTMDGRLAPKRWSSVALVWFLQGQAQTLQLIEGLLDRDDWQYDEDEVPAITVRVALASRLMRVLHEISTCCGSRQPTGGVEAYVKVFGIKKKKSDLRSHATVVLYKLVTLQAETFDELSPDGNSSYYPFTDQAVEDLARGSAIGDGDIERMECAAAAYALQARCWDPRLLTFCVRKLAQSLKLHGSDSVSDRLTLLSPPAATSSQKKAGSFAGVFEEGATTLNAFLRAMHPNCYEGLLNLLVEIVERCYGVKQQPKSKTRRKKRKKEEEVGRYVYIAFAVAVCLL
jgi:hypothetical protein